MNAGSAGLRGSDSETAPLVSSWKAPPSRQAAVEARGGFASPLGRVASDGANGRKPGLRRPEAGRRKMSVEERLSSKFSCYVAADLGASSGRVIAAQAVEGVAAARSESFSTAFVEDADSGYLCWPLDAIEEHVRQVSPRRPVWLRSGAWRDSWGVDYVSGWGATACGKAICYRDDRTQGMIERIAARIRRPDLSKNRHSVSALQHHLSTGRHGCRGAGVLSRTRHLLMIPTTCIFACAAYWQMNTPIDHDATAQVEWEWDEELFRAADFRASGCSAVEAGTCLEPCAAARRRNRGGAGDPRHGVACGTPLEADGEAFISSGPGR